MKVLSRLLIISLFSSALNVSCQTANIPDFEACPVELPYSGDGYCKRVVSLKSRRIPKEQWVKERRTMVCLPHESYKMIKREFYKSCFNNQCKQALDSVGDVFEALDSAVKAIK